MWVNYKTKPYMVRDIYWSLHKWNDMMPEVCFKIFQEKNGRWIDKIKLVKCSELLELDDWFMGVHYVILSTFRCIWNIPYHNKKLNKYLLRKEKLFLAVPWCSYELISVLQLSAFLSFQCIIIYSTGIQLGKLISSKDIINNLLLSQLNKTLVSACCLW